MNQRNRIEKAVAQTFEGGKTVFIYKDADRYTFDVVQNEHVCCSTHHELTDADVESYDDESLLKVVRNLCGLRPEPPQAQFVDPRSV